MKITYIEVDATPEDLRANKNLSENLYDALNNALWRMNNQTNTGDTEEEREEK